MPTLSPDAMALMMLPEPPEVHWLPGDDLCNCTFQRIGDWTNPYLARTLRVRLCCIWGEIYKQYPEYVEVIPAYYDSNRHAWETEPAPWDSESSAMPLFLWYRQMEAQTGKSLDQIRDEYRGRERERPQAVPKGTGKESRKEPSAATVKRAHEKRLRLTGWITD